MRVIKRYRIHLGTFAWILHRLSGIGLIVYLLAHIWVIHHLIKGKEAFDGIMETLNTPLAHFLEIGLIGVVFYHLFNGLRVTLVDMGVLVKKQKALFGVSVVLWLITWGIVGFFMAKTFHLI